MKGRVSVVGLLILLIGTVGPVAARDVQLELIMPSAMIHPGETFFLDLQVRNFGSDLFGAQLYVLLDLGTGSYWCFPSWCEYPDELDCQEVHLPAGYNRVHPILPEFIWPVGFTPYQEAMFWAGVTSQGELASDLAWSSFGWADPLPSPTSTPVPPTQAPTGTPTPAPTVPPTEIPPATATPLPPTCPPETIVGHRPWAGWESWLAHASDLGSPGGWLQFDDFAFPGAETACGLHWWGLEPYGANQAGFDIVLYGSITGDPEQGPDLTDELLRHEDVLPGRSIVGAWGEHDLMYYSLPISPCQDWSSADWISIRANDDGDDENIWYWTGTPAGNGRHAWGFDQNEAPPLQQGDHELAFCITDSWVEPTASPTPDLGASCAVPALVTLPADLPFTDQGRTTCGFGDDYDSTCLDDYDGGEDFIYRIDVTSQVVVDLTFDPNGTSWTGLAIDDQCPPGQSCLFALESGSSADAWSRTLVLPSGVWYLMVDVWPPPDCIPAFDLSLEEGVEPPSSHCGNALEISLPQDLPHSDLAATTCGLGNHYDATCLLVYDGGEDSIYKIIVTSQTCIDLTFDPNGTDDVSLVLDDSCPPDSDCIYTYLGDHLGEPHSTSLLLEPGGYYLMIDTWPNPNCISDYDLTLAQCVVVPTYTPIPPCVLPWSGSDEAYYSYGNDVSGAVAYDFVDLTGIGTQLQFDRNWDNGISVIDLGPSGLMVDYFGATYDALTVCTNGRIEMGESEYDDSLYWCLPINLPDNLWFPFLTDLVIHQDYGAFVRWDIQGTPPDRVLVIHWHCFYDYAAPLRIDPIDFEVKYLESQAAWEFHYADLEDITTTRSNAALAIIGMQRFHSQYTEYACATVDSVCAGTAIRFWPSAR